MVPEHAGLMCKRQANLGATARHSSLFRIYMTYKHLGDTDRLEARACCPKTGRDLFRRHFLSIIKGAIRHTDL